MSCIPSMKEQKVAHYEWRSNGNSTGAYQPENEKAFRKLLSQVVLWVSVAVIAMIAVPTTVLALAITGIWQLADHILAKLERRE